MDDLGEKLAGILNDPESMERVRQMAENILGENKAEETASSPLGDIGSMLGGDEIQSIIAVVSRLKNSGDDPRSKLLNALKPHLSEPRREKVDTAIKILKLIELLPLIKETGLLKL